MMFQLSLGPLVDLKQEAVTADCFFQVIPKSAVFRHSFDFLLHSYLFSYFRHKGLIDSVPADSVDSWIPCAGHASYRQGSQGRQTTKASVVDAPGRPCAERFGIR